MGSHFSEATDIPQWHLPFCFNTDIQLRVMLEHLKKNVLQACFLVKSRHSELGSSLILCQHHASQCARSVNVEMAGVVTQTAGFQTAS